MEWTVALMDLNRMTTAVIIASRPPAIARIARLGI
jgi:hypothetical protein